MRIDASLCMAAAIVMAGILSGPSQAHADCGKISVAAGEIPYFVESAEKGQFVELFRAAAKRAGLELDIKLYPKKRALSLFRMGAVDVLLPHSSAGGDVPSYKSIPILNKRDFVFVRDGAPVPSSVKDLEGRRIGLTAQYSYPKSLTSNEKIQFSRAPNSDLQNIKMLSVGRFDGAIIEEHSGLKAMAEAGVENVVYDKTRPIDELRVWILFSKSDCGKVIMQKINGAFGAMIDDGEWNAIKKRAAANG